MIQVILVKAFTNDPRAGNPAGVILNADNLTSEHMQMISAELNFSESVFVVKSDKADYKMRYFSPSKEIDYCAHATLAACGTLRVIQSLKSHETNIGIFKIAVNNESGLITLWQQAPTMGPIIEPKIVAPLLNISVDKINSDIPCQIVSTGIPKLLIAIKSLDDLFGIKPDFDGIKEFCKISGARGFYPFTQETLLKGSHFHARQFNPLAGIYEDPITGIAAGPLGAYWQYYHPDSDCSYIVEQGHIMGKFGQIQVNANKNFNKPITISGYTAIFGERLLTC